MAGFSGKLVAGDVLSVTLEGEPYGYASFAVDGVTDGVAMRANPAGGGGYKRSSCRAHLDSATGRLTTWLASDDVRFDSHS